MLRRIDPALLARARELRNNPTETELAVWRLISRHRPAFTRQHIVAPFIIDLACRQAKLGVEFDGSQHIAEADRDERRSAYLRTRGWRVIRLWNSEVLSNPEGAVEYILAQTAECLGGAPPQALASRAGRERKQRWN
ncbi:DUF559 domain-containing protein [Sphingomonas sp. KR3-1]|uniref:endonuclease domain-containing protein n=1 Tax=Sphingomonas sp. KR3-1 TaxID=3156611 RepID=UPI0032B5383D